MKLDAWLTASRTRDVEFAKRIGVSRVTLFRFKTGRRIPDRQIMEKINVETAGSVEPNDFFNVLESERAGVPEVAA